jgi:hypothetical protein
LHAHAAESQLEAIGWALDRAASVEIRRGDYTRGVAVPLYEAALRAQRGRPLCLDAATRLVDSIKPGDTVLVATGAGHPVHLPAGETDGPLGAAALARVLAIGLGALPVFVACQEHAAPISAAAEAVGLPNVPLVSVRSDADGTREATRQFRDLAPRAVIAIEALAPNVNGVAHSATGLPTEGVRSGVEHLVDVARREGVLTIGIGDNGNEIGFGLIEREVRRVKPYGDVCRCPCGGGIASSVATDVLVVANVSNWGAYAVEAMVGALLGDETMIHDATAENAMLSRAVAAGARDGSSGRPDLLVDGSSTAVNDAVLTILTGIVHNGLQQPPARPF